MVKRRGVGPGVSFFAFQDIITAVVGIFILITLILVLELAQRVEAASAGKSPDIAPLAEAAETLESEVERLQGEYQRRAAEAASSAKLNAFNRNDMLEQMRNAKAAAESRLTQVDQQLQRIQEEVAKAERASDRLLSEAADLESERQATREAAGKRQEVRRRIALLAVDESVFFRDKTDAGRFITLLTFSASQVEIRDALTRSIETMSGGRRFGQMRDWLNTVDLSRRQLFLLIEPGGAADFETLETAFEDSGAIYGFSVVEADHGFRLGFELEDLP